jgi:short-subunit dehydrogenase
MQTILGASGQIARELARELKRNYTDDLRLVSRHPQKVNDSDETLPPICSMRSKPGTR